MFEEFSQRKADIDGIEICFVAGGAGPPVLLLHGFPQCRALWGDLPAEWRSRLADMTAASLPGGHFFVDQFPEHTARTLGEFLGRI